MIRGDQARDAEDKRDGELRQRILFQRAKELGSDLVAGGEEKEIKEDILYHGGNLDVQLPYRDSREQRAHSRAQAKRPDLKSADEEADRQS